eukprot:TRINITY_DN29148_c1_g5_i1.p1 TRINITY_DN29148_c1_g5~~TRINITY_DN29148_c1_g5_i1.p1  ORF type:complete len:898 (+),score=207.20 TRINITY_DN29148_c1_g5_i1:119-2812(+)
MAQKPPASSLQVAPPVPLARSRVGSPPRKEAARARGPRFSASYGSGKSGLASALNDPQLLLRPKSHSLPRSLQPLPQPDRLASERHGKGKGQSAASRATSESHASALSSSSSTSALPGSSTGLHESAKMSSGLSSSAKLSEQLGTRTSLGQAGLAAVNGLPASSPVGARARKPFLVEWLTELGEEQPCCQPSQASRAFLGAAAPLAYSPKSAFSPKNLMKQLEASRAETCELRRQLEEKHRQLSQTEQQAEERAALAEARRNEATMALTELTEFRVQSRQQQDQLVESLLYAEGRRRSSEDERDATVARMESLEARLAEQEHNSSLRSRTPPDPGGYASQEQRSSTPTPAPPRPPGLPVLRRAASPGMREHSPTASLPTDSPTPTSMRCWSPITPPEGLGAAAPTVTLRCLYAAPLVINEGTPLPKLNAKAEIAAITKAVAGSFLHVEVGVASVSSLRKAVTEPGLWLHLTMHSMSGKALLLEDPDPISDSHSAEAHVLWQQQLKDLLSAGGGAANTFLFLSACESEALALAFRDAGIQHVVCCITPVRDTAAYCFAHYFYHAIANRRSLRDAFAIAACTARCSGDQARYGLLSDGNLWLTPPSSIPPRPSTPCTPFNIPRCTSSGSIGGSTPHHHQRSNATAAALPRESEDFVGRQRVINEVLHHLKRRRAVVLHSEAPLGLTATLVEIAHYVTSPGRMFAPPSCCAFHPHEAPGGLLIVDDADELSPEETDKLQGHLAADGAKLLLGCRAACYDILGGAEKAVHVPLPPLSPAEAARLFLQRCHRPLQAADLLPPEEMGSDEDPSRVVGGPEALALLKKRIAAFAGDPGKVRRAAEQVRPGSPALKGDLKGLLGAAPLPVQGAAGRALKASRRSSSNTSAVHRCTASGAAAQDRR